MAMLKTRLKWRCPSCSNSGLWNGIPREPFGALRSVMARFFFTFHALSFELNLFFDGSFPLKRQHQQIVEGP